MYFDVFASQLYPSMLTTFVEVSFQAYKRQLVHPKIYIHVYTFGWQGNQVQVIDSLSKIEKLSIEKKKGEENDRGCSWQGYCEFNNMNNWKRRYECER